MDNLIEVKGLTKRYGKVVALSNVNINIAGGKIIGLLGPNGSGKTTFLKCLAGLLTAEEGNITIDGKKVGVETKKCVSFLPERTFLDPSMSIKDILDYFECFFSDFDRQKAVAMLESLHVPANARIKHLSKGTREKIQLVLIMSRRAKLFLLDEPIAGVDPAARDFILETIISKYREGATIIISTHLILDIESILDEYIFVNNNILTDYGSVKDVHDSGRTVDQIFREEFRCY